MPPETAPKHNVRFFLHSVYMRSVCAILRIQFFFIFRYTTTNNCIRPCGPMNRMLDFDASEPGSILVGYEIFLSFIFCNLFNFMQLFGALSIRYTYVGYINQVGLVCVAFPALLLYTSDVIRKA